jgi:hypothetical protein
MHDDSPPRLSGHKSSLDTLGLEHCWVAGCMVPYGSMVQRSTSTLQSRSSDRVLLK